MSDKTIVELSNQHDSVEIRNDEFTVIMVCCDYFERKLTSFSAAQAAQIGQALIDYSKKVKFK